MMSFLSGQIVFIVWREAVEAVLIISIMLAFLKKTSVVNGLRNMWIGVAGGIILSVILGIGMLEVQNQLEDRNLVLFQSGILLLSSLLMTQMVMWMSKYGRSLKPDLERNLGAAVNSHQFVIAGIAMLSVAREGIETVVYIYGISLQQQISSLVLICSVLTALALSLLVAWMLSTGIRHFSSKLFFKVTSGVLLISAAGLILHAAGKLVQENILPGIIEPLWNSSKLIPTDGLFANVLTGFIGYTPSPSLSEVLAYFFYWSVVLILMNLNNLNKKAAV